METVDPQRLDAQSVVLILVGLVGSGKSTFAEALQNYFSYFRFRRCSQDELGDRSLVEDLARTTLRDGFSVCIDRTNADSSRRAHWIRIAQEFPGTPVWVLVFDTPVSVCAARLRGRTNHPTIKTPERGLEVLRRFASSYEPPNPEEGFNCLLRLPPSDQSLSYTQKEVDRILRRIRDSPVRNVLRQTYFNPRGGFLDPQARGRVWSPSFWRGDRTGSFGGSVTQHPSSWRSDREPDSHQPPNARRGSSYWRSPPSSTSTCNAHGGSSQQRGSWRSTVPQAPESGLHDDGWGPSNSIAQ